MAGSRKDVFVYVYMHVYVCVVVIKEQCHSSWLLWGYSMTVKVDVAAGDLRCLMTQELHD